jgi:hypothetical protein
VHFDGTKHVSGRMTHCHEVRVLVVQRVQRAQHLQSGRQLVRIDLSVGRVFRRHTTGYGVETAPDCAGSLYRDRSAGTTFVVMYNLQLA